ncbi:helix-turn-helix transcriptional regulator [Tsukamurella tyrosinosolvens]|uniref:helix-turn-helix domain-containing protein n=1 Tax=Tsukamurella tyrosinosolvens TaxID=57704 RepID=UPI001CE17417|nr:helix-turn-helix transcriptional regulator [Tsukamurella tyrosinosolvens]MCA4997750.1 helix-turn-helix transcriptional regulator [Tsukamurella tyrosinosolvens]
MESGTTAAGGGDWQRRLASAVGRNMQALRESQGVSAAALSDRCKSLGLPIARATISKVENGLRYVDLGELLVIASALGTSPAALLYADCMVDAPVNVLPTQTVPGVRALLWFSGEAPLAVDDTGHAAQYRQANEALQIARTVEGSREDLKYATSQTREDAEGLAVEVARRALVTARRRATAAKEEGLVVRGGDDG